MPSESDPEAADINSSESDDIALIRNRVWKLWALK
ncbi:hypothetical protein GcM3_203039 [Golovinomyces cichoracearum]|uniref:Uncharacterized protein n=1 Tax=Golovinomyces cichoracearum TaxID=62708 RepID=A0A420HCN9_9PEZI|nr:hypothetical protein GcM3_203039 [Golovinomyces cichoracearum]